MSQFRTLPQRDYAIIRNEALRDPRLSLKAKGALAMMLSFPPDWTYRQTHLETLSADGRDALRAAIRELEDLGYIRREQQHAEHGRFARVDYVVGDIPTADGFSGDGKPGDGLSGDGKPATTKTEGTKTELTKTERPSSPTSPNGDTSLQVRKEVEARKPTRQPDIQQVVDAYNTHRGPLPAVQTLNDWRTRKIRGLIRDLGSAKEATAVMGIAAAEVAGDEFWQRRGYGFDNLLRERRAIQKAETAVNRGTTDRAESERQRLLAALGPN